MVHQIMAREGVAGEARLEHPSLEDVFVAVTHNGNDAAQAGGRS